MFFSLQIYAEKTLAASRLAPSTRRHTDSQSVSVCEVVSGDRCPCVRKNRARAQARTCFTALLYSSRTERTRTCDVIGSLVCVDHHVATVHFSAASFFATAHAHRDALSIRMTILTRVSSVLSESESQKRDRWTLLSSHDTSRCVKVFVYHVI